MRLLFILIFGFQFNLCCCQDTSFYKTTGLLVYQYDKSKISKDFIALRKKLRNQRHAYSHLTKDLLLNNDNFFINGEKYFTKNCLTNFPQTKDSLFIWHVSDYYGLVFLLEKEFGFKFAIFTEMPCINAPYISVKGIRNAAFKIFYVNGIFKEVNLFVKDEEYCNRLNGACDLFKFSVGRSYKIFILQKIEMIYSYLDNLRNDKNIKILKIPSL